MSINLIFHSKKTIMTISFLNYLLTSINPLERDKKTRPTSSLRTYQPTLQFTPWSLDLFIRVPFQLHGEHTFLQPFRRIGLIVHIVISVLHGTHSHLGQVKNARVK